MADPEHVAVQGQPEEVHDVDEHDDAVDDEHDDALDEHNDAVDDEHDNPDDDHGEHDDHDADDHSAATGAAGAHRNSASVHALRVAEWRFVELGSDFVVAAPVR